MLLTDVPAVQLGYGSPDAQSLHHVTAGELREHDFAAGSMGPKIEAACRFVERTGHIAGIGALADAAAIIEGHAGTVIWPSDITPDEDRLVAAAHDRFGP